VNIPSCTLVSLVVNALVSLVVNALVSLVVNAFGTPRIRHLFACVLNFFSVCLPLFLRSAP
jgi:hypothetical protein